MASFLKKLFDITPVGMVYNLAKGVVTGNVSDIVPDAIQGVFSKYTGASLTPAEQEANLFTANEAQKQRDFEERMSNTAYQRQIADMQAAGVNPALVVSGGSGASTPSGSAATSVSPNTGELLSAITQIVSLPAQLNLLKSQAAKNNAEASSISISNETLGEQNRLILDNLRSDLDSKDVQRQLAMSGISKNEADTALANTQAALNRCDEKTRNELNGAIIALRNAESAKFTQDVKESAARIEVCKAQVQELLQRAITEAAQAFSLDAQAGLTEALKANALVENGILILDEKSKTYEYDNRKVKFWIDTTTKAITSAATAVGAAGIVKKAYSMTQTPVNLVTAPANSFNPYRMPGML